MESSHEKKSLLVKSSREKKSRLSDRVNESGYYFVSPFLLFFAFIVLVPVVISLLFSFMRIGTGFTWVGFQNYIDMFRDPLLFQSYYNVLLLMVFSIPITMILALFLAVLLNSTHLKGRGFFRTVYYIPTVTSVVAIASVFMTFFDPAGLFNLILNRFGIESIQWLTHPFWLRVSMVITVVWMNTGYNTILFLAGLQGLPTEIYESAEIDGASKVKQFFLITIPLLKSIILMAVVLATIGGLSTFEIPNIFFGSSNGPENAALTVGVNLYKTSFEAVNFGKASAIAWSMVFVASIISAIQFKLGGKNDEK
ncbi:lactose/L-arabinose transport system permease [Enterococcus sp. AZ194]|uniref:carbohydrate ABC transporter permease n=1 Tax=Enterococcus sp. AZ194 TaxID=2774629 RepID=UPI003F260A31